MQKSKRVRRGPAKDPVRTIADGGSVNRQSNTVDLPRRATRNAIHHAIRHATYLELLVIEMVFDVEDVRLEGIFGGDFAFGDLVFFRVFLRLVYHSLNILLGQPTLAAETTKNI